jgi:tetratricopeptide (TPR) repeat protein
MRHIATLLLAVAALPLAAQTHAHTDAEHLGTVSFATSCAPASQTSFNRGVALLHDFWYEEAQSQFDKIAVADPACGMAYWGQAMSGFHQIWDRPNEKISAAAWAELQKVPATFGTPREREYIAALSTFFKPGPATYETRIVAYADAMGVLYAHFPKDVDAGAFYALALLADESPDDVTLAHERKAMTVLAPLFAQYPDNPGVVHYITHACDTPALAAQGLAAAEHYGPIASTAPHAIHMPGHIFARLGMWQADIDSNTASVDAAHVAESRHQSGFFDQFHADEFLLYAYLQSGQDEKAKAVISSANANLLKMKDMPEMSSMGGAMGPYYEAKLPTFYDLEMRDWKAAEALEPPPGANKPTIFMTYWAQIVGAGHLGDAQKARESLVAFELGLAELRKTPQAYEADSTSAQIVHTEMQAWTALTEHQPGQAVAFMTAAADLQDKVGQGEVDIPAREMLADMLLDLRQPDKALPQYVLDLKLSPNRFNGLYHAGLAAEMTGDKAKAVGYYTALLKSTDNGAHTSRPELTHAKQYLAGNQLAQR